MEGLYNTTAFANNIANSPSKNTNLVKYKNIGISSFRKEFVY